MKLYLIQPDIAPIMTAPALVKARSNEAVGPIAELILNYFRADSFPALIGLSSLNRPEPSPDAMPPYPPLAPGQHGFGRYRVTHFQSEADVRAALWRMGDAYVGGAEFFCIRSMISCRSVTYGYDGQAFLCLRTEDAAPVSPDPASIVVEDRSELLLDNDLMDGVPAVEDW